MSAGRFLLRRAVLALLLVFIVSSAALVLTRLAPGDVTLTERGLEATAEQRAALRAKYGLDRSIPAQYLDWLAHAARLDFGHSVVFSRPVNDLLAERAKNTATLALVALLLATVIGIPAGVYTGSHGGGAFALLLRGVSLLVLSVPPLLGSLALLLIAARTGWLSIGGLALPAIALAAPLAAMLERLQAQSIEEAGSESFVRAALARGISREDAIWRHAWPVSLGPVLGLYGVAIGTLLSGSFVVEVVTSWPGLGRLMYDALRARDVYLVAGCAATGAFFLALGTLIADLLLVFVDPRRRAETAV